MGTGGGARPTPGSPHALPRTRWEGGGRPWTGSPGPGPAARPHRSEPGWEAAPEGLRRGGSGAALRSRGPGSARRVPAALRPAAVTLGGRAGPGEAGTGLREARPEPGDGRRKMAGGRHRRAGGSAWRSPGRACALGGR